MRIGTRAAGAQPVPAALLDIVPALMLAAAVGFIASVAPIDLLERLVARSGLPALIPAAAPPLGATARAITAAGSAAITLAASWFLLRAIGRRRRPVVSEATSAGEPRLRAADRHPDAPARRPFSAAQAFAADAAPELPPEVLVDPTRPLDQRSIGELLSTLEDRLCARYDDPAASGRLRRGHG